MLSNKTNHQTNDGKNLITSESNPEQTSSLDEVFFKVFFI